MSVTEFTHAAERVGHIVPSRFVAAARGLWHAIRRRHAEKVAITHLRELTDAQMSDIGLSRADILAAVYGQPRV